MIYESSGQFCADTFAELEEFRKRFKVHESYYRTNEDGNKYIHIYNRRKRSRIYGKDIRENVPYAEFQAAILLMNHTEPVTIEKRDSPYEDE